MIRLSNSRRMDLIDILDEARGRIGDKSSTYICSAILLSQGKYVDKEYLIIWIERMLGNDDLLMRCCSLDSWLITKGYMDRFYYVNEDSAAYRKLYRTRLAWIDWMRNQLWCER